jgi:hypothetical protein
VLICFSFLDSKLLFELNKQIVFHLNHPSFSDINEGRQSKLFCKALVCVFGLCGFVNVLAVRWRKSNKNFSTASSLAFFFFVLRQCPVYFVYVVIC